VDIDTIHFTQSLGISVPDPSLVFHLPGLDLPLDQLAMARICLVFNVFNNLNHFFPDEVPEPEGGVYLAPPWPSLWYLLPSEFE
jgi:hypothetical protein